MLAAAYARVSGQISVLTEPCIRYLVTNIPLVRSANPSVRPIDEHVVHCPDQILICGTRESFARSGAVALWPHHGETDGKAAVSGRRDARVRLRVYRIEQYRSNPAGTIFSKAKYAA